MKTKHLLLSLLVFFSFISLSSMCEDDIDVDPEQDKRDNIVQTWHCQRLHEDEVDPLDYDVIIKKDPEDENKIIMIGFFNDNEATTTATITGFNITLPRQEVDGFFLEGDGVIQDDYQRITWTYTADGEQVSATFTPGPVTKRN